MISGSLQTYLPIVGGFSYYSDYSEWIESLLSQ